MSAILSASSHSGDVVVSAPEASSWKPAAAAVSGSSSSGDHAASAGYYPPSLQSKLVNQWGTGSCKTLPPFNPNPSYSALGASADPNRPNYYVLCSTTAPYYPNTSGPYDVDSIQPYVQTYLEQNFPIGPQMPSSAAPNLALTISNLLKQGNTNDSCGAIFTSTPFNATQAQQAQYQYPAGNEDGDITNLACFAWLDDNSQQGQNRRYYGMMFWQYETLTQPSMPEGCLSRVLHVLLCHSDNATGDDNKRSQTSQRRTVQSVDGTEMSRGSAVSQSAS